MQKLNDVGGRCADQKQEASEREPSSQSSSGSGGRAGGVTLWEIENFEDELDVRQDLAHGIRLEPGLDHGDDFHHAIAITEQGVRFVNPPDKLCPRLPSSSQPSALRFPNRAC